MEDQVILAMPGVNVVLNFTNNSSRDTPTFDGSSGIYFKNAKHEFCTQRVSWTAFAKLVAMCLLKVLHKICGFQHKLR